VSVWLANDEIGFTLLRYARNVAMPGCVMVPLCFLLQFIYRQVPRRPPTRTPATEATVAHGVKCVCTVDCDVSCRVHGRMSVGLFVFCVTESNTVTSHGKGCVRCVCGMGSDPMRDGAAWGSECESIIASCILITFLGKRCRVDTLYARR
jgi:hypothetical protein